MGIAKSGSREKKQRENFAAVGFGTEENGKKAKRAKRSDERKPQERPSLRPKEPRLLRMGSKSIQGTLISAFLVPIVLIIILGAVSYITASNTIKNKVEESSESTMAAMGMYCEMMMKNVSSKALDLVASDDLANYYDIYAKRESTEARNYWREARTKMLQIKASVNYIYSFSTIPAIGSYISSFSGDMGENPMEGFLASPEGQFFAENSSHKNAWCGYHTFLDERMKGSKDQYGLAFVQKFLVSNTYLVLDINTKTIEEMLQMLDFGDNTIKALIAPDGREIVRIQQGEADVKPEEEMPYFTDKEFYLESVAEGVGGSRYITYDGASYLYLYTPVGNTGVMMCSLVPQRNILKEVDSIRNLCIAMIILACIIAFLIGTVIATGMSKSVKMITAGLDKVSEGDLTQNFAVKRKDEFGLLGKGLNDMLTSMRTLMADMKKFGNQVKEMADGVAVKSDTINTSIKEISHAVDEVASGAQTQAQDAENSNHKMTGFAVKVDGACRGAGDMGNTIDQATAAVGQGRVIVDDLSKKTETTVQITKILVENIRDVQERSTEIEGFIDTISNIATQTNLLSLNASIEAARAGEHGRGFSVVAEEIRKLADESMQAGKKIKDIVDNIMETTQKTADSAQEAETIVFAQADSLKETIEVFGDINDCVEKLVNGLQDIADGMREISGEKDQVQESIQNISVVSEQSAAAAVQVTSSLDEQVKTVSDLTEEVELLKKEADALERSISRFIL